MFVLRALGPENGFDVFFDVCGNIDQAGLRRVEYAVASDDCVAKAGVSVYNCRVSGFKIGERGLQSGNLQVGFVGGVGWFGADELDEHAKVFDKGIVTDL